METKKVYDLQNFKIISKIVVKYFSSFNLTYNCSSQKHVILILLVLLLNKIRHLQYRCIKKNWKTMRTLPPNSTTTIQFQCTIPHSFEIFVSNQSSRMVAISSLSISSSLRNSISFSTVATRSPDHSFRRSQVEFSDCFKFSISLRIHIFFFKQTIII